MRQGDKVLFNPKRGKKMEAEVAFAPTQTQIDIIIGNDPFPVTVPLTQVERIGCEENGKAVVSKKLRKARGDKKGSQTMASTTEKAKPSSKELRKQAQGLGVKGWQDMTRKELAKAVRKAQSAEDEAPAAKSKPKPKSAKPKAKATKPATKAAPAKSKKRPAAVKKAAPKAKAAVKETGDGITLNANALRPTPAHGVNPFRPKSDLSRVAKLLLKGGKRETLASKLSTQIDLHPYQKDAKDVDLLDYDKRLLLGAQTMRDKFGYGIRRTGRGLSGTILVFVPGGPTDPRKGAKKATKKK